MIDLPLDPTLLAFLVNESRSRRPDLSGDDAARYWVKKPLLQSVVRLWDDFSKTVYPKDDIELSVRNSFFRMKIIEELKDSPGAFINVAAGLTSYPYYLPENIVSYEFDSELMMSFKSARAKDVIRSADLDQRKINYISIDLDSRDLSALENVLATINSNKIILLEGISYYLQNNQWRTLLSIIRNYCGADDIVLFDFWHEKDRKKIVFDRFRQFVNRHARKEIQNFNFLNINEGIRYNGFIVKWITDVYEQEERVRNHMSVIRLDEYAEKNLIYTDKLNKNSAYTMPERYGALVIDRLVI